MLCGRARRSSAPAPPLLTSLPEIKRVGVVGLGLMGHGIAQTAAEKGFEVVAVESESRFLESGMARIEASVKKLGEKAVKKGKMSAEDAEAAAAATLGRISPSLDRAVFADCDVIVEAVIEDLALKKPLYEEIGRVVKDTCIIASNTSSLAIHKMGAFSGRPTQMVGLHFFNPVQLMQLVEVVRTDQTDPVLFQGAMGFAKSLGKTPVECIDTEGFVVNRLLVPYLIEAISLVDRGVASAPDVDVAMKLGAGHPMGPIHLADYMASTPSTISSRVGSPTFPTTRLTRCRRRSRPRWTRASWGARRARATTNGRATSWQRECHTHA